MENIPPPVLHQPQKLGADRVNPSCMKGVGMTPNGFLKITLLRINQN